MNKKKHHIGLNIKYNIIYLVGLLVLSASIIVTFAAFVFNQTAFVNANLGNIRINSQKYVIYAKDNNYSINDSKYSKTEKLRNDTVAIIDEIALDYEDIIVETQDEKFIAGKTYYSDESGTTTVTFEPNSDISGTYYEKTRKYTGFKDGVKGFDSNADDVLWNVDSTDKKKLSAQVGDKIITVTCVLNDVTGSISSASVMVGDEDEGFKAVVGTDGLSIVIIDESKTVDDEYYSLIDADERMTCSATEAKNPTSNGKRYYLSQIGFQFSFTSEIASYVRIHIQDAWTRTRVYTSTNKQVYEMKDQIGGMSPFTVTNNDWYYDKSTNCIYLKKMFNPEKDENGNFEEQSYIFNVNEAYYYALSNSGIYSEYVDVEVSFTVDVVQANRVQALWGFNPSEITNS